MVKCELCGLEFDRISASHLKHKHGLNSIIEYWEKCPGVPTCSEESSKRTSEANSGYVPTLDTIKKLRESHMGIGPSEETRELLRRSTKGWWDNSSPEERLDRLNKSFLSEETQIKVANGVRKRYENMTDEERYTSTASLRDPEVVKRRAETNRKNWADKTPEERRNHMRPAVEAAYKLQNPNGPEKQLWKFLEQFFPGILVPDWIERIDIGGRHPDFRTKNGYRLVIESNGSRFHSDWGEEEQVAHYKKYGYDCIVVWADSADDIIYEWPDLAGRIRVALGI